VGELNVSVMIHLTPIEQENLSEAARQMGVAPEAYAEQTVREHLPTLGQAPTSHLDERGWPHGFFEQTFGSLADDPLTRPPQGDWEEQEQ
jgi:hypothetical protein